MIVQCPECSVRYNLKDDLIGPEGRKVRCTRCGHVFQVFRPDEGFIEDAVDQVFSKTPAFFDDAGKSHNGSEKDGPAASESETPRKKGRGRKIFLWLLFVLLVLVGVGIGAYYYAPHLLDNTGTGTFTKNTVEEQKSNPDTIIPEIALENVRQYFVKNEKIGQIFVVEGKAVNEFDAPKESIKLRVKLFDDKGQVIGSREFLCGNVVSYFQLQVLKQEELESALTAKVGVMTNNTNVKPGTGVPFMAVFTNPPETLSEFALEPIEAKDPSE
jgi:predicted Zn finger-like uncharacterized protein